MDDGRQTEVKGRHRGRIPDFSRYAAQAVSRRELWQADDQSGGLKRAYSCASCKLSILTLFFAASGRTFTVTRRPSWPLRSCGFSTFQTDLSDSRTSTRGCAVHSGWPTDAPPRLHLRTQSSRPGLVCSAPQAASLTHAAHVSVWFRARPETGNKVVSRAKTRTARNIFIDCPL